MGKAVGWLLLAITVALLGLVIHEAGQPADHPVMTHHPEGRYLKFIVGRVLPVF